MVDEKIQPLLDGRPGGDENPEGKTPAIPPAWPADFEDDGASDSAAQHAAFTYGSLRRNQMATRKNAVRAMLN